nr:hypothetical protein Iba_chr13eCG10760 [Ipomoea batatas]
MCCRRRSGNSSRRADREHLLCCRTVEGYLSSRDRVDIFHSCSLYLMPWIFVIVNGGAAMCCST